MHEMWQQLGHLLIVIDTVARKSGEQVPRQSNPQ